MVITHEWLADQETTVEMVDTPRELMAGQQGIWYAQQLDPGNTIFNAGEYGEIRGPLDLDVFAGAVRRAVGEARSLHARFVSEDGTVRQDLSRLSDWTLHRVDVTGHEDPKAAAEEWMWADMRRPVDLATGPLFTQALFTAGPDRYFWYTRCHHIAADGFSSPVVFARVVAIYNAIRTGHGGPGEGDPDRRPEAARHPLGADDRRHRRLHPPADRRGRGGARGADARPGAVGGTGRL